MVLMASAMLDMVMDMPDMEDTMAPMLLLLLLVVLPSVVMDSLPLLLTMLPMAMLLLESMLLTLSVLSTLPRGLLTLMPTMVDMESTLDPRLLVSPPSLMLDSLCKDMPPDMAMDLDTMARGLLMLMLTMVLMASAMLDMVMDMPDMEDTMAPMLPLLLLVVLPSVVMDSLPLLLTTPPMAMLL